MFASPLARWIILSLALLLGAGSLFLLRQRMRRAREGRRQGKRLVAFSLAVFLFAMLITTNALARQRALAMLHPGRSVVQPPPPQFHLTGYQEVEFSAPDGLILKGWYLPSHNGAAVIVGFFERSLK